MGPGTFDFASNHFQMNLIDGVTRRNNSLFFKKTSEMPLAPFYHSVYDIKIARTGELKHIHMVRSTLLDIHGLNFFSAKWTGNQSITLDHNGDAPHAKTVVITRVYLAIGSSVEAYAAANTLRLCLGFLRLVV